MLEKMKKPTTHLKKTIFCFLFYIFSVNAFTQTLYTPTPIKNPNFGGSGSPWTSACASASFNEYFVNFTWSAFPAVNSNNTFVLELSNSSGDFTSPVTLATITDKNTIKDFNIKFAIPNNTRGTNYKLRVKSTSPVIYSPPTQGYNMYYISYKNPIQITANGSGIIGDGTMYICNGSTGVIAIDNIPNPETYQYIWRKSSTVLSEKGPSLTVVDPGMYSVEIDYGPTCSGSAGTLSNLITVITGNAIGVTINPPINTTFCFADPAPPLEATIADADLFYTWYKDGSIVKTRTKGAYSYSLDTTDPIFAGAYTVKVEGADICTEITPAINIYETPNYIPTFNNPIDLMLLPGQPRTLSVTTNAPSPTYQWYRNGIRIEGATTNTLSTDQDGEYLVELTQIGSCSGAKNSSQTTVANPSSLELVIDYSTSYSDCQQASTVLNTKTIYAVASNGEKTDVTEELKNMLSYQWKKDGSVIGGANSSSLSLTDVLENGTYQVSGSVDNFNSESNNLTVILRGIENITIEASSLTSCSSSDTIIISTARDLTGESFQWLKDGTVINTTDNEISTTLTGTYELVVSQTGCPLSSNKIIITPFDESLITLDTPNTILLTEGNSTVVTASGGTSYEWLDSANNVISSSNSVSLTTQGIYTLKAYINDCVVIKQLTVTYKDINRIPNVITPNGDGINDLWMLPNTYSKKPEINVTIYNNKGLEIFNVDNYQNNWPESSITFPKQNMVFYYKIKKGSTIIKQGTITVIK